MIKYGKPPIPFGKGGIGGRRRLAKGFEIGNNLISLRAGAVICQVIEKKSWNRRHFYSKELARTLKSVC
jgi:hypothetical protein